jgi:hypothetical protein
MSTCTLASGEARSSSREFQAITDISRAARTANPSTSKCRVRQRGALFPGTPASAFGLHAIAARQSCRAENVQYWLVDTVRRQCAKAIEVRAVLELDSPSQHASDVGLPTICELEDVLHHYCRVYRTEGSIAVCALGAHTNRAGGAAFWIRLAQHNRKMVRLRKRMHDVVARVHVFAFFAILMRTWP